MPANEFVHPVIWLITKNFSEFSKCEIIYRTSLKCNYNYEIEDRNMSVMSVKKIVLKNNAQRISLLCS